MFVKIDLAKYLQFYFDNRFIKKQSFSEKHTKDKSKGTNDIFIQIFTNFLFYLIIQKLGGDYCTTQSYIGWDINNAKISKFSKPP